MEKQQFLEEIRNFTSLSPQNFKLTVGLTVDEQLLAENLTEVKSSLTVPVPLNKEILLKVAANCSCYIWIIRVDSSGKTELVFPSPSESNLLTLNKTIEKALASENCVGEATIHIFAANELLKIRYLYSGTDYANENLLSFLQAEKDFIQGVADKGNSLEKSKFHQECAVCTINYLVEDKELLPSISAPLAPPAPSDLTIPFNTLTKKDENRKFERKNNSRAKLYASFLIILTFGFILVYLLTRPFVSQLNQPKFLFPAISNKETDYKIENPPQVLTTRAIKVFSANKPVKGELGDYYALVIGNDNYKNFPNLSAAVNDAVAVAEVLRQFNFKEIKLLEDASSEDTKRALASYKDLPEQSNLLIYYAGHGDFSETYKKGYWIPVDGERKNGEEINWIGGDLINELISKGIHSKHVLIISDSCFAGTMANWRTTRGNASERELGKLATQRSRTLMASGGNEPVADGQIRDTQGKIHSAFAYYFVKALTTFPGERIAAQELFYSHIKDDLSKLQDEWQKKQGRQNPQSPDYIKLIDEKNEFGDFIFIRKPSIE